MSVIVEIKVNTKLIASYVISRTTPEINPINTYTVERNFPDQRPAAGESPVYVNHRYWTPVEQLVEKALPAAVAAFGEVPR